MLADSRPKYLTLGLLGVMMALLIAGLIYTQGNAHAEIGSETGATVAAGADVAPTIECKWELPDMMYRPGYVLVGGTIDTTTKPDGKIQYEDGAVHLDLFGTVGMVDLPEYVAHVFYGIAVYRHPELDIPLRYGREGVKMRWRFDLNHVHRPWDLLGRTAGARNVAGIWDRPI